ncbi:MAG: sigma-54 dependent transcriptional regulator [Beijerinckiaceae bacterium]|nr:sigma-54 dependent transcriptional regulator [Beijerinckiaceae bacterium]
MNARPSPRILIIEDTLSLAESYAACLRAISTSIEIVGDGETALAALHRVQPDVILLDVNLPDMSGIDLLRRVRKSGITSDVIIMTGEGSIRLTVEAMRSGARDFLVKPFGIERLRQSVTHALEERVRSRAVIATENRAAPAPRQPTDKGFVGFIGRSPCMQEVYRLLEAAAPSNATVFITGESGTGKELCAEALHRLSKRSAGPFVVINCAAIPRDLLESEIFGHVKGAFTGAIADRKGAALLANGGTLFLDEICEMDVALQSKLLRFLQDRQVRRVGEDTPRAADVRIVCATNRHPHLEVAAGRFREDLLYRLYVVPVDLPPLKARERDIILIARDFLDRFAREDGKALRVFSRDAEDALVAYAWPGNVRQLQNVIRSVVVLNDGDVVTRDMLPVQIRTNAPSLLLASQACPPGEAPAAAAPHTAPAPQPCIKPLDLVIRETIEFAIARCGGSIPKAAAALTVSPSTLYRRIQTWEAESAVGFSS